MNNLPPTTYAIRVNGHLDDHWSAWLGELGMTRDDDGTTTVTVSTTDQAQLHGVLAGLRDIGAVLIELRTTDAPVPPAFRSASDHSHGTGAGRPARSATSSSSAGVPVQIVRTCSVIISTGQFHQAMRSSRAMSSSENRRRISRAGLPTTIP